MECSHIVIRPPSIGNISKTVVFGDNVIVENERGRLNGNRYWMVKEDQTVMIVVETLLNASLWMMTRLCSGYRGC